MGKNDELSMKVKYGSNMCRTKTRKVPPASNGWLMTQKWTLKRRNGWPGSQTTQEGGWETPDTRTHCFHGMVCTASKAAEYDELPLQNRRLYLLENEAEGKGLVSSFTDLISTASLCTTTFEAQKTSRRVTNDICKLNNLFAPYLLLPPFIMDQGGS